MPDTVTLDREAVVDLLVEVHAVCDVVSAIVGTGASLTEGLASAEAALFDDVFPDLDDDTLDIYYDAADANAREIVSWLAKPREIDHA
jgi:hypothetical protein